MIEKQKYGYRNYGGGFMATYIVRNANELKGKRKATQMRFIAEQFGLDLDWIMERNWNVSKSGNLAYHPATYILDIIG